MARQRELRAMKNAIESMPKDKQRQILMSLTPQERRVMELRMGLATPSQDAAEAQKALDEKMKKSKE